MQEMSPFATEIMQNRYAHDVPQGDGVRKETWDEIANRVVRSVLDAVPSIDSTTRAKMFRAVRERKFIPGGRYLYAAGRPYHQVQNCLLLRAQDSREGWGEIMQHSTMALMTGAGLGINYSDLRAENEPLIRAGGVSSGPISLAEMVNALARGARQGGARRGALWAGLRWNHPDIHKFIKAKDWSDDLRAMKAKDFNAAAPLDCTNISVCLDDDFFRAYSMPWHKEHDLAHTVYWATIASMLQSGEPGFSIDTGINASENLRNACTEITSADDSDICNIGSINLARVKDRAEFNEMVNLGTLFLLAGSLYSDVPYKKVEQIRSKNRRLGLGLMGVHEWLLVRGKKYGPDEELGAWLSDYALSTGIAHGWADMLKITRPIKTRAFAPNGTIGIIGETTTSAEPMTYVAYKRRFRDGEVWKAQYVVDPCAKRLIEEHGIRPDAIETSETLATEVERRVSMQAWIQTFVDHAISSTINLPAWSEYGAKQAGYELWFGTMLMKYLPYLRGITVYPDGSRSGQPITYCSYEEAIGGQGETFIEGADICDITKGGSCG